MTLVGIVIGLVLGVPFGLLLGGLLEANGEDSGTTGLQGARTSRRLATGPVVLRRGE